MNLDTQTLIQIIDTSNKTTSQLITILDILKSSKPIDDFINVNSHNQRNGIWAALYLLSNLKYKLVGKDTIVPLSDRNPLCLIQKGQVHCLKNDHGKTEQAFRNLSVFGQFSIFGSGQIINQNLIYLSKQNTHLGYITLGIFEQFKRKQKRRLEQLKKSWIKKSYFKWFQGWRQQYFIKCDTFNYTPSEFVYGAFVYKQGNLNNNSIYIVKKGEFVVTKKIKINSLTLQQQKDIKQLDQKAGEAFTIRQINLFHLKAGDSFGEIDLVKNNLNREHTINCVSQYAQLQQITIERLNSLKQVVNDASYSIDYQLQRYCIEYEKKSQERYELEKGVFLNHISFMKRKISPRTKCLLEGNTQQIFQLFRTIEHKKKELQLSKQYSQRDYIIKSIERIDQFMIHSTKTQNLLQSRKYLQTLLENFYKIKVNQLDKNQVKKQHPQLIYSSNQRIKTARSNKGEGIGQKKQVYCQNLAIKYKKMVQQDNIIDKKLKNQQLTNCDRPFYVDYFNQFTSPFQKGLPEKKYDIFKVVQKNRRQLNLKNNQLIYQKTNNLIKNMRQQQKKKNKQHEEVGQYNFKNKQIKQKFISSNMSKISQNSPLKQQQVIKKKKKKVIKKVRSMGELDDVKMQQNHGLVIKSYKRYKQKTKEYVIQKNGDYSKIHELLHKKKKKCNLRASLPYKFSIKLNYIK